MPSSSISFRAAAPTLDEGRLFAGYLDQAAEGFFRMMLGRRSGDILATVYQEEGHDLSYQNVSFAERDGEIVGMISGYTAEEHRQSSTRPLVEAAGKFNLRMMTISILFAPLLRVIDTVADHDFYLQAIAVDEQLRGAGVGTALIDFIEARARDAGAVRLALDVSAKNEGARKLYERRGMHIESQWPKRLPLPGLRLFRMTKVL